MLFMCLYIVALVYQSSVYRSGLFELEFANDCEKAKNILFCSCFFCLSLYVASIYYLFPCIHIVTRLSLARINQANKFSFVVGILLRLGFEQEKVVC